MATRRFGISKGGHFGNVNEAVGAATAVDGIELTVDLATVNTKEQVLLGIEYLEAYIMKSNWPPA